MSKVVAYGICLYKKTDEKIYILLCKSVKSSHRWGALKGVALEDEQPQDTAIREFEEESSIKIEKKYLEKLFFQENISKDIGIYLVNYDNISDIEQYFQDDILFDRYLSSENSMVKFFDIKNLPLIKKKQYKIIENISEYLKGNSYA